MIVKDLIDKLSNLCPESEVIIEVNYGELYQLEESAITERYVTNTIDLVHDCEQDVDSKKATVIKL